MIARRVLFNTAVVLFTLSSALVAGAAGELKKIGPAKVEFFAKGPAGLAINGTSSDLSAKDSGDKLALTAGMNSFQTGNGLRDKHLKKYMETAKFPNAKLVVEKSKIKMPEDKKSTQGNMTGKYTMHGVTKTVKFDYQAKRLGSDYLVQGKFGVDILDYGIEQPCYLGVCMDTKVNIKVSFKLRQ